MIVLLCVTSQSAVKTSKKILPRNLWHWWLSRVWTTIWKWIQMNAGWRAFQDPWECLNEKQRVLIFTNYWTQSTHILKRSRSVKATFYFNYAWIAFNNVILGNHSRSLYLYIGSVCDTSSANVWNMVYYLYYDFVDKLIHTSYDWFNPLP